jgi:caspase domain-containing protein
MNKVLERPMLRSALLFLLAFLLPISAGPARADKRVALVIGISNYQQVPRLADPSRDADALSALFRKSGFDVMDSERDLGKRRAIREFSGRSRAPPATQSAPAQRRTGPPQKFATSG